MTSTPIRTPSALRRAISKLPEDERTNSPKVWYRSQREHWLGWLEKYESPGAYGRKVTSGRDARFAYNHVVEPKMLLYLAEAAGVDSSRVAEARRYAEAGPTMMARSAWIRRHVPWPVIEAALWRDRRGSLGLGRLLNRRRT